VGLIRYEDIHGVSGSEFRGIAGSADGVASYRYEPEREPLMLEFKCPLSRKIIPDTVPQHYYAQVFFRVPLSPFSHFCLLGSVC